MQEIHVTGRLICDAELKKSVKGKPYANALISVVNGNSDMLFKVVAFDDLASQLASLRKGQNLSVVGRQTLSIWESDNGPKVNADVLANALVATRPAGARGNAIGSKPRGSGKDAAQRTMHDEFSRGTVNDAQDGAPPWEP